jgi:hypothetical protein
MNTVGVIEAVAIALLCATLFSGVIIGLVLRTRRKH